MIFLSILIALLLERVFPQFIELRRFDWLREYTRWLVDVLHIERFGRWASLLALLLPIALVVWIAAGLFDHALFGLFELAFDTLIVFFTLGPKLLDRQVDDYIDAIETGDEAQRQRIAAQVSGNDSASNLAAEVAGFCRGLFVEANSRVFALLFWFVALGPLGAVIYRILQQLLQPGMLASSLAGVKSEIRLLLGWMDWLPVRISLFAYMISGNFDEALQSYRKGADSAIDLAEQNSELLQSVGASAISALTVTDDVHAIALVRKARGLYLRSLIVWLLILLLPALV